MIQSEPKLLWRADERTRKASHLNMYMQWLKSTKGLAFNNYDELWEWSIDHIEEFWQSIVDYFEVKIHTPASSVLQGSQMPGYEWFPGSHLNYAEHIFKNYSTSNPAIIHKTEQRPLEKMEWAELKSQVEKVAHFLREQNVGKGDRVAGFIANIPEATVAFLATISVGAVWSSCSPDFGPGSVMERFEQIEPKVIFAVDGYSYGGKKYNKIDVVEKIANGIPSIKDLVMIRLNETHDQPDVRSEKIEWDEILRSSAPPLTFEAVPFSHPIWVLYSSGTTGQPKAITHSHGGVLLEHLKYMAFHNDVHKGENFFWYSTTGWMMWNFTQAALLMGATIVLYDGSPAYPDLEGLWELAEEANIHHFGTSAPYIVACMNQEIEAGSKYKLEQMRSIGSTGSPLPPEGFDWIYKNVNDRLWLCSMSGGTDVCTAFVGGVITEPVYLGEIQRRALGCSLFAFDEKGNKVKEEVGEMVITKPMPSMPIYFWNDENKERYRESYFEEYPGVWRHGDWVYITKRNTLVILGRSDATLNRQGVRIGTAEIYRAVEQLREINNSLIVNLELENGDHYMPLFVQVNEGYELDQDLIGKIKKELRGTYSPRHVPDEIIEVDQIPLTISGKKMETPVKKILMGMSVDKAASRDAMKNPEALDFFIEFSSKRK